MIGTSADWERVMLCDCGNNIDRDRNSAINTILVALSCSESPEGFARWSLRLLADKVVELGYIENLSHETIRCTLKKRNETMAKNGNSPGKKQ